MNESNESIQRRTRKFINKYYNEASLVLEAIDETVDQDILIELTTPGYYREYRIKAINYIDETPEENQKLFIKLAKEDLDKEVRSAASNKINGESSSDQLLFIDLAKRGHVNAIKKIKSESILAEIAYNTSIDKIFQEAVSNIQDEKLLTDIGSKFPESETCDYIIDKINNQEVLTEIICHNHSFKICNKAFQKITNSSSFNQIAIECEFYQFRVASIDKINDKNILKSIFKNDENDYVRLCALEKCKTQELLTEILVNKHYDNRILFEYALDNINDDDILKYAFKNAHYRNNEILSRIKDESFLAEIAYNSDNEYQRELALKSLMKEFNETKNKSKTKDLDIKTKMYIDVLEKEIHQLEDFPESYLSFSRIENNCLYLNLTEYIDPFHLKFLTSDETSWDYFRTNDLATKFRPFDFKYDIKIINKYESY